VALRDQLVDVAAVPSVGIRGHDDIDTVGLAVDCSILSPHLSDPQDR
jgi:hypothetical protein